VKQPNESTLRAAKRLLHGTYGLTLLVKTQLIFLALPSEGQNHWRGMPAPARLDHRLTIAQPGGPGIDNLAEFRRVSEKSEFLRSSVCSDSAV